MKKNKSDRIINILLHLLKGHSYTKQEYLEEFQVSRNTFSRDFEILKYEYNLDIDCDAFEKNKVLKLKSYAFFETSLINQNERLDLLVALKSYATIDHKLNDLIDSLEKTWNIDDRVVEPWLEVDLKRWITDDYPDNSLSLIKEAILNKNKLKCKYALSSYITKNNPNYSDKGIVDLLILPKKIVYKDNGFYVSAQGKNKKQYLYKVIRMFDLEEVKNVEPLTDYDVYEPVDYRKNIDNFDANTYTFEFKVPITSLWLVMGSYPEEDYKINYQDKYIQITLCRHKNHFLSQLFKFENYVYDIKPKHVRELYLEALNESLTKNK